MSLELLNVFGIMADAPGGITLNVVSMERNSMLTNCLIECGHLTITVSEIEIY